MPSSQPELNIKFDPQSYLLSYINDNSALFNTLTKQQQHEYVKILKTSQQSLPTTLAILNNSNIEAINKGYFRKHLEDYFIPTITLFRIDYDDNNKPTEKRFYFENQHAEITSFDLRLAGSNPITAEKQVEVTIKFKFGSLAAFCGNANKAAQSSDDLNNVTEGSAFAAMFEAWNNANGDNNNNSFIGAGLEWGDKITKNYWSLIFHPSINNINQQNGGDRTVYDTTKFRIKATIGRNDNDDSYSKIRNLLNNDSNARNIYGNTEEYIAKLKNFVRSSNKSFILNLTRHEFKVIPSITNLGKVQIELTANYIAEFESETHNYNLNILGDLLGQLDKIKNQTTGDLLAPSRAEQAAAEAAAAAAALDAVTTRSRAAGVIYTPITPLAPSIDAQNLNLNNDDRKGATSYLDTLSTNQLAVYNKLINTILNAKNEGEIKTCLSALGVKQQDAITKYTELSKSTAAKAKLVNELQEYETEINKLVEQESIKIKNEYYSNFIKTLLGENNKYYSVSLDKATREQWVNWANNNKLKPNFPSLTPNGNTNLEDFSRKTSDAQQSETNDELQQELDKLRQQYTDQTLNADATDTLPIVFTTFGHVVDSAYKSIEVLLDRTDSTLSNNEKEKRKKSLSTHKSILCDLSNEAPVFNISDQKIVNTVNMADIPIDVNLIKIFLIDYIIKPQKLIYSLYAFLKDITSVLVINALNMKTVYNAEVNKNSDVSLATSLLTLGSSDGNDPLFSTNTTIEANNITYDYVEKLTINAYNTNHTDYYSYYIMYDKNLKDFSGDGTIIANTKKSIAHLDASVVNSFTKEVSFNRIDQPYLKEAKSVGQKTFYLGQFRDFYNATIEVVGNCVFYPGMVVYVVPFADAPVDFSTITGIGGYYTVIEINSSIEIASKMWKTTLKTIFHSAATNDLIQKAKATDKKCDEFVGQLKPENSADPNAAATALAALTSGVAIEAQIENLQEQIDELNQKRRDNVVGANNDIVDINLVNQIKKLEQKIEELQSNL